MTTLSGPVQSRVGASTTWTLADPTLLSGEIGVESDTLRIKIGNGTSAWTALAYVQDTLSEITSGAAAPNSTPTKLGNVYIDTTADKAYISVGTASSADWLDVSGAAGGVADLTWTASTKTVASSTGTDAVLTDVDATNSGLMTPAYRASLLAAPTISSGAVAPTSTPSKVGDVYIDTAADVAYVATGTASSADWIPLPDADTVPSVSSGSGLPSSTPLKVGDFYVDTTNTRLYFSVDTNDSDDWEPVTARSIQLYERGTFDTDAVEDSYGSVFRSPGSGTLDYIKIWCAAAPVSADVIVDLFKNTVTVFSGGTGRPILTTAGSDRVKKSGTPSTQTMAEDDEFQPQIVQFNAGDQGAAPGGIGQLVWEIGYTVSI